MKRQQLEITLQRLKPLRTRSERLEQYSTPADVAAEMVWHAFSEGDIQERSVADLGCGNGVLAIAAKLMGASQVLGIDLDPKTLEVAFENARALGLDIRFREGDVTTAEGKFDTVLQNPPFGAQKRHADRAFVRKALELAPRVYSLHNAGTETFVARMVEGLGAECRLVKRFKFEIPFSFEFHKKPKETFSMVLLKFER